MPISTIELHLSLALNVPDIKVSTLTHRHDDFDLNDEANKIGNVSVVFFKTYFSRNFCNSVARWP